MRLRREGARWFLTVVASLWTTCCAAQFNQTFYSPPGIMQRRAEAGRLHFLLSNDGSLFFNPRYWTDLESSWPSDSQYIAFDYQAQGLWFAAKKQGRKLVSPTGAWYAFRLGAGTPQFDQFVPGFIGDPAAPADTVFNGAGWKHVNDPNYVVYKSTDYDSRGVDQSGNNFPDWPLRLVNGVTTYIHDVLQRGSYAPVWPADEVYFCIYKDTETKADPEYRGPTANPDSFSVPIGIEVRQTVLFWGQGPLRDVMVVDYGVLNKSGNVLDSSFIGFLVKPFVQRWQIMGLPRAIDTNTVQFYATDPRRELGFEFNPLLERDVAPVKPYVGLTLLRTPLDNDGQELGLSFWTGDLRSGTSIDQPTIPFSDVFRYDWMARNQIDPPASYVPGGVWGHVPPLFSMFSGSGPFRMEPGDTVHFTVALMVGNGLPGLLRLDDLVKRVYANGYLVPEPPLEPALVAQPLEGAVHLAWDSRAERSVDVIVPDSLGRAFVGYRLYRARSREGPYYRVKQWELGKDSLVHEYVDRGQDGIDTTMPAGLMNNVSYFYKLTAYDEGAPLLSLDPMESTGEIIEVKPGGFPKEAGDVSEVRVVPNPYVVSHGAQKSVEQPVVYFNYLPEECTIRIYTVALDLVRVLRHSGGSSELWDLTTEGGQQVGSQLFIAHIETPQGKRAIRKFAIITGE